MTPLQAQKAIKNNSTAEINPTYLPLLRGKSLKFILDYMERVGVNEVLYSPTFYQYYKYRSFSDVYVAITELLPKLTLKRFLDYVGSIMEDKIYPHFCSDINKFMLVFDKPGATKEGLDYEISHYAGDYECDTDPEQTFIMTYLLKNAK